MLPASLAADPSLTATKDSEKTRNRGILVLKVATVSNTRAARSLAPQVTVPVGGQLLRESALESPPGAG